MDPDGPPSRVERTFWAVWYYITGAVNRFLRPEITNDDTSSTQESAAVSEPVDVCPVEGDASGRLVDEDQTPAADSLLSPSRPLVAWEFCTADIHLDPDEESVRYETQPRRGSESKASEGGEGVREEAGHDDERPPVAKEDGDRKLTAGGQDETSDDGVYEEHANAMSIRLTGDEGDVEKSGRKAGAQEETERAMTPEDPGKIRNTQVKEEDDKEDEGESGLPALTVVSPEEEEDAVHMEEVNVQMDEAAVRHEEVENGDGVPQLASEKCDEGEQQVETQPSAREDLKGDPNVTSWHNESQMAAEKSGTESEDEPILMEQEHVMVHRSQSDKEEEEEEEGEGTLDEDAAIREENMDDAAINQTTSEAPEQRGDTEPVTEDDVAEDTEVQTKTREEDDVETESTVIDEKSDVTTTHHSVDGRIDDEDRVGEETLSGEAGDHENTAASVTVKPEGQTGQEMSGEFKNIAALPELSFPTCEETQEGVPEYNNEPGPDENTTQRFLEGGDGKEIQGSQLPEEVESKEAESLKSSGISTGADHSLAEEHEEKQESTQYIKSSFDAVTESQESGYLFEEEEGELVVESMKTGIDVSLTEESDEAAKELHDGNEELLVECEVGEGLFDSRADGDGRETPDAATAEEALGSTEGQKTTETSFFQESVDAMSSDQSGDVNPNLLEDITEFGFLKHYDETEPKSHDDVGIVMEEMGFGVEEAEAAEDELPNKSETEKTEWESSRPVDQPSHEALETSHEEMLRDTEAADEWKSKPEDLTLISADKVSESEGSFVNDEEILNLMALSQDADAIKQQEGPEPGQEMESSNEEREEISSVQTEKDEEQLVGSELVSDTDMSSSTVESGFLDQSLGEPQLLRSTSTGSLHGICDMLASVSDPADVSEPSTQRLDSQSRDTVMKETDEKEEESIRERDSGVPSPEAPHLNQESDKSPEDTEEERVESTETGSHNEFEGTDWKDTEEGDAESEAEMSALFEVEKATAEADLLEITASDSPSEIERSESGQSDTALVDEMVPNSGSQGDAHTESERKLPLVEEPQPGWSDDVAESSPGLNGADVAEQPPPTTTEDWMQMDTSVLDFTLQRSRISVKNRRVKPPKDARSLLHRPSLDPTPSVDPTPTRVPAGVPLGAMGIGIKLPGLGGGFPVLKKTQRTVREEVSPDTFSQVDTSVLDFTAQKSRISVKNPRVKPPKDPRSLLHLPSADPTPSEDPTPSPHPSARVPAGLPLGGLGMGIKLPGLGAGFPVLKKTQRTVREENSPDTISQDAKEEARSDTPKQDEAQHTPKWISPRHPGVGNPLMSELMTKLKKTTKE